MSTLKLMNVVSTKTSTYLFDRVDSSEIIKVTNSAQAFSYLDRLEYVIKLVKPVVIVLGFAYLSFMMIQANYDIQWQQYNVSVFSVWLCTIMMILW
jgi:lipoprotein signal peptidase